MKKKYTIVYEDTYLIVVDKIAGVPVIPSRSSEMPSSLKYSLKNNYEDIFIVHRIDAETTGLVVVAKDAETHRKLNTLFVQRKIEKKYLALTKGLLNPSSGSIELALKKLNNQNKSIVSKDGKHALTQYKTLEVFKHIALVEAEILTGRHHQIRVHFASSNAPLLVDKTYGKDAFYLSEVKGKHYRKGRYEEERPLMSRLSLHASSLKFQHPVTDELCSFESPLPKDFRATVNQLRKLL